MRTPSKATVVTVAITAACASGVIGTAATYAATNDTPSSHSVSQMSDRAGGPGGAHRRGFGRGHHEAPTTPGRRGLGPDMPDRKDNDGLRRGHPNEDGHPGNRTKRFHTGGPAGASRETPENRGPNGDQTERRGLKNDGPDLSPSKRRGHPGLGHAHGHNRGRHDGLDFDHHPRHSMSHRHDTNNSVTPQSDPAQSEPRRPLDPEEPTTP